MNKDDFEQNLRWDVHKILKPLFKQLIKRIGQTKIVQNRVKAGFNQEWIKRLHKALYEFCDSEPSTIVGDHCFIDYGKPFADIACTLLDSERFWSPRRYAKLLETLEKYELLDKNKFPKPTENLVALMQDGNGARDKLLFEINAPHKRIMELLNEIKEKLGKDHFTITIREEQKSVTR